MIQDTINAAFEWFGALVLLLDIRAILRDKSVSGVSLAPKFVFCVWGFWNIYYYGHLDQEGSQIAAAGVTVVNSVWLYLALKYSWKSYGR